MVYSIRACCQGPRACPPAAQEPPARAAGRRPDAARASARAVTSASAAMQPLKIRHKRARVNHGAALVFDFETSGVQGVSPPDQPPIQVSYSVLRLGSDEMPEVLHESFLISDCADTVGPFHQGYHTFMRGFGVELDPSETDPQRLLQTCRTLIKTTAEYKGRDARGKAALTKMLGKLAGAQDRFTLAQLRRDGVPLRDAAAAIMHAIREHDVRYLVAHNAHHMDVPHLRAAIATLQDPAALTALDQLGVVDTMVDTHFRTAFLPPPPSSANSRPPSPPYPLDVRVLGAFTEGDGRIVLRVAPADPIHTLGAVVRKFALRIDVDDGDERREDMARLFAYDFHEQPAVFAASVRDETTLWLFHDPVKTRPLHGPPDTTVSLAHATAHPVTRNLLKFPSQDDLLARYGLLNDDAHDASADVRALCALLRHGQWCPRTLAYGFGDMVKEVFPPMHYGDPMQFEDARTGAVVDGVFCGIVPRSAQKWGVRVRNSRNGAVYEYDHGRVTRVLV